MIVEKAMAGLAPVQSSRNRNRNRAGDYCLVVVVSLGVRLGTRFRRCQVPGASDEQPWNLHMGYQAVALVRLVDQESLGALLNVQPQWSPSGDTGMSGRELDHLVGWLWA